MSGGDGKNKRTAEPRVMMGNQGQIALIHSTPMVITKPNDKSVICRSQETGGSIALCHRITKGQQIVSNPTQSSSQLKSLGLVASVNTQQTSCKASNSGFAFQAPKLAKLAPKPSADGPAKTQNRGQKSICASSASSFKEQLIKTRRILPAPTSNEPRKQAINSSGTQKTSSCMRGSSDVTNQTTKYLAGKKPVQICSNDQNMVRSLFGGFALQPVLAAHPTVCQSSLSDVGALKTSKTAHGQKPPPPLRKIAPAVSVSEAVHENAKNMLLEKHHKTSFSADLSKLRQTLAKNVSQEKVNQQQSRDGRILKKPKRFIAEVNETQAKQKFESESESLMCDPCFVVLERSSCKPNEIKFQLSTKSRTHSPIQPCPKHCPKTSLC